MRPDNHVDSLRDPRRDQLLRPAGRQRVQVGAQGHRRAGQAGDGIEAGAGPGVAALTGRS